MTLFTIRTASSHESTGMTDATGPKISSRAMRASGLTSVKIVGWKKDPLARSPSRAGSPPITSWRLLSADRGIAGDPLDRRFVDDRPDVGLSRAARRPARGARRDRAGDRRTRRGPHDARPGARPPCSAGRRSRSRPDDRSRARSRSASSQITIGFLPPSSRERASGSLRRAARSRSRSRCAR